MFTAIAASINFHRRRPVADNDQFDGLWNMARKCRAIIKHKIFIAMRFLLRRLANASRWVTGVLIIVCSVSVKNLKNISISMCFFIIAEKSFKWLY